MNSIDISIRDVFIVIHFMYLLQVLCWLDIIYNSSKQIQKMYYWYTAYSRKLSSKQQKIEGWRQKFLSGLQSAGLEMEDVSSRNSLSTC